MAEDTSASERTEQPTQRRVLQAHDDGRVPKSQELAAAVVVMAGSAALAGFGGTALGNGASDAMRQAAGWLSADPVNQASAAAMLRGVSNALLLALAPFLLAILLPTLLVNGLQARGVLSAKPIMPDFSRVSPGAGLQRLFAAQAIFALLKALAKLIVLGFITWTALSLSWPSITALSGAGAAAVLLAARAAIIQLVLYAGLAFLGLAVVDYGFSAWQHSKELRMSRQEVVQEFRETEGNPLVKSRMRSLAASLSRRRMLHRVAEADVVIVNPTEIAVAIRYDASLGPAPIVLAMGRRKLAQRIRDLARLSKIPVVENVPVARALIATAIIGQPIPPALYAAVAEVLAFVYRQRGHMPAGLVEARNA